jgi:hypothetical protein
MNKATFNPPLKHMNRIRPMHRKSVRRVTGLISDSLYYLTYNAGTLVMMRVESLKGFFMLKSIGSMFVSAKSR